MAQKIIYSCDICGKKDDNKGKGKVRLDYYSPNRETVELNDLCDQCFKAVKFYIKELMVESEK